MMLITGASGQLASLVAAGAKSAGMQVHTASRSRHADRQMDFDRPETLNFIGIDTLFLTSAGYAEDDVVTRRHGAVLGAARDQGVKHIIYTSLTEAGDHLGFALAHRWTERAVRDSGMAWTILRNGLYAELIGALAAPRDGRIRAPLGTAGISAVCRADLAEAAVAVLKDPAAHTSASYDLSGSTALSAPDIARQISVPYDPTSLADERNRLSRLPLLPFQAPMLMSIFSAAMAGFLETRTTDLGELVPRPANALTVAAEVAGQSLEV